VVVEVMSPLVWMIAVCAVIADLTELLRPRLSCGGVYAVKQLAHPYLMSLRSQHRPVLLAAASAHQVV